MTRFWDGKTDRQTDGQTDGVTTLLDLLSPSATQVKMYANFKHIVSLIQFKQISVGFVSRLGS